ncbi:MAG: hypothetical protein ACOY4L_00925 [Pseudomonadota bacterium]
MAIADALPRKKPSLLRQLGPGLITGASDDEPGGIATYSQVGAQFGYQMLWTAWFLYPLMGGIQEIAPASAGSPATASPATSAATIPLCSTAPSPCSCWPT